MLAFVAVSLVGTLINVFVGGLVGMLVGKGRAASTAGARCGRCRSAPRGELAGPKLATLGAGQGRLHRPATGTEGPTIVGEDPILVVPTSLDVMPPLATTNAKGVLLSTLRITSTSASETETPISSPVLPAPPCTTFLLV